MPATTLCRNCQQTFSIDELDQNFLQKIQIPNPTLCPQCRMQRRMSWRNDRNLYERTCDFSGEKIISMFSPNSKVPVIHKNIWWSDSWDGRKYGRDIDWSHPTC